MCQLSGEDTGAEDEAEEEAEEVAVEMSLALQVSQVLLLHSGGSKRTRAVERTTIGEIRELERWRGVGSLVSLANVTQFMQPSERCIVRYSAVSAVQQSAAFQLTNTYSTYAGSYITAQCYCRLLPAKHLLVEVEFILLAPSLDLAGVRILQILLNDVVPVLPNSPQSRLLHDCTNHCTAQRIVSHDQ